MQCASICTLYLNDSFLFVILLPQLFCDNFYNDFLEDLKGRKKKYIKMTKYTNNYTI